MARKRDPLRLLTGVIMLFEVSSLTLIAVKPPGVSLEALVLAVALPALCWLSTVLLPKLFPIDRLLMALTNFLCGVGIIILYSIVPETGMRQAQFYALGLGAMMAALVVVRWVDRWGALCWLVMPVSIGLLVLPVVAGQWNNGAKNWVSMPWIGMFQPSELVKLALVVVLAWFLSSRRGLRGQVPAVLFVLGCLGILGLQRDLGTALMYYLTGLAMYFVSSSNVLMTLLGLGGGAAAAVVGYNLFAHVKVRVAIWLNPWADALGNGYQIIQALMAIGSGGLFGLGLGLGLPRTIPVYHTDFIFAVICEQFGILFGLGVMLVYIALLIRGFSIALRARKSFHALLAFGCTTLIGVQTFVIVAGVIKMIPLTGITMPFVSYGGTSLISCLTLIGILHGVESRVLVDDERDAAIIEAAEEVAA